MVRNLLAESIFYLTDTLFKFTSEKVCNFTRHMHQFLCAFFNLRFKADWYISIQFLLIALGCNYISLDILG